MSPISEVMGTYSPNEVVYSQPSAQVHIIHVTIMLFMICCDTQLQNMSPMSGLQYMPPMSEETGTDYSDIFGYSQYSSHVRVDR